ncbi:MAG: hypothetical protein NC347_01655 [Clostridium sp.]|nr:hypothetical protein [Clostridium sp.]
MNSIKRGNQAPVELGQTDKKFKELIKGKTNEQAYNFYKENKHKYLYNTEETKAEFAQMNFKRCSFCTKPISDFSRAMTVEHIETKAACPEKIFQWDNLLCSCSTCNTLRGTKPYVSGKYLDPTREENVEKYFTFKADGSISVNKILTKSEKEKAKYMIDLYKLDRDDLNVERREFLNDLLDDEFYDILKNKGKESMHIIFLSVFTYYKRRKEDGE